MSRPISASMAAALDQGMPLLLLAEIEHPSGTARFWSGVGILQWNGQAWTGSGTLGTISPIRHTSDLKIQEIAFTMTGVSPADVSGLDDNVRNLSGQAWLACLDERGAVIADPLRIVDAELDFQSFSADDQSSILTITGRSGFYTLVRAIDERWSAEDQKQLYPDDAGLDFVAGLQNQDIQWTPT